MSVTLYLIRHAHAGQGNPDDPQDHLRPLSAKGRQQAEILAHTCTHLGVNFDRLFSSPYSRAVQTAEPLLQLTGGALETLFELTSNAYDDLLTTLQGVLKPDDDTVALVGHEPFLSAFVSFLLTGDEESVKLRFRKGMMVELGGPLRAGGLELRSALSSRQLERLSNRSAHATFPPNRPG